MTELAFASATEIARRIRAKEISATEALQYFLDRVDRYNKDINAIVVDSRQAAKQDAEAIDQAIADDKTNGQFIGVPMTVKESYNLVGEATTFGNPDWVDNVVSEDAEAVKRLKRSGVTVFGKPMSRWL